MVILILGSVIAGILVFTTHLHVLADPFDAEPHAWGSAHFATIARSYAEQGFLALKGLPIGNNQPLGREPDAYLHWPPLFSILLGITFKLLGISEAVARGFVLFVGVCVVVAIGWLAKLCYGPRASAAAIFSALTVPVFSNYVCLVQLTTLGILFMLLALIGFLKATGDETVKKNWIWFGLTAMLLAVSSSWEPALLPFGLLLTSLIQRNRARTRLAIAYFGAVFVGIIIIISYYFIAMPNLAGDFLESLLFRIGFGVYSKSGHISLNSLVNSNYYQFQPTVLELLSRYLGQFIVFVGWPYLVIILLALALSFLFRRRFSQDSSAMPLALLTPVILWYALISHQAFDNEFEVLLAMPLVSICFALLLSKGLDILSRIVAGKTRALLIVPISILVIALLLPVWRLNRIVHDQPLQPTGMLDYANDIRNNTEPNAVVISPFPSMVPVFYSHRHIIRGISNRESLRYVMDRVGLDFPGSPVYIALPGNISVPSQSLGKWHVVTRNMHVLLMELMQ